MRILFPKLHERRTIDGLLTSFFREYRLPDFQRAVGALSRFYALPRPRVAWFEYLDWGKSAGRTYEDGNIHLVHPENWKRGRKYRSERQWVHTVYHEMGHYVLWADPERKADRFARRFVRGIALRTDGEGGDHSRGPLLSRARRKHTRRAARRRRR